MPFSFDFFCLRPLFFKAITISILSLTFTSSTGQIFQAEQNPPSIKWHQINTQNFQVIYPTELEKEAQEVTAKLENLISRVSFSLKKTPRKISVILQNQGTTSNGFVQLAPRRSEFFTTPPQEFDYQNWLNSLAIHELRHVIQFDKLTGKLPAPFFEGLALAVFGITLPSWFYEGDAVGIETALTNAGRGRQPEWDLTFRTNTLSGKKFSYSKNFFGSVKDFTPGYYQLGFYMTTKLRRDYGCEILDSAYRRISGNPFRPYNLSRSLKKITKLTTKMLHDSTVKELQNLWSKQLHSEERKEYKTLNNRTNKIPENYLLPVAEPGSNSTLVLKESKAKTSAIIEVDSTGRERIILKIGAQEESHFSYANDLLVWDEFRFDPRFQKRSFNVINSYDIKTKKVKQLTHKTRLFAPALSPKADVLAAVEVSYSNRISLVLLNAKTGKEMKRFGSPNNYMLQTPSFDPTGNKIVVTAVAQEGKTLLTLDLKTKTFKQLIPFQSQLISRPVFAGNDIIFKAHYNGIDNLYRLNPQTQKITQVTSVKFGALSPSYDNTSNKIYFSNYSVNGYDIASLTPQIEEELPGFNTESYSIDYIHPIVKQEGNKNVFADSLPVPNYTSKPYRELSNLFYFHSLEPIIEENIYDEYNYGLRIRSDNKLNTLSFYTGYRFNNALKKSEYQAGFTYSKYYPILDFGYTNQARLIYRRETTPEGIKLTAITWRENVLNSEISIPFLFNRFNRIYNINLKTGTSYTTRYDVINGNQNFITTLRFPMHYQIALSHSNRKAARDLAPRWGQALTLTYRHFPFERLASGELLTLRSLFYFPGVGLNHSFQASFNYQNGSGNYRNTNDIPYVSGYNNIRPTSNLENTLLFDYRFPLFYPDWELSSIAYIKRLKAGLFADFENVGFKNEFSPRTFGAELRADMNLLRFQLPNFDIGGKIIFVNEKPRQNPIFETTLFYTF